jgi:SAM-dependent methyltransferase
MTPTRTWDAATYDRVSAPQVAWSEAVLDRLQLRGDELVLDAGCGSGRVTQLLLDRLPEGRVIALDSDADMVRATRERFAGDPRVQVVHQSLTELNLAEQVDAVFSGATFHWVLDHDELFARLGRATKPGGRISAQCGGEGNIAHVKGIADRLFPLEPPRTWCYAGPDETRGRLERNGFTDVQTWLQPWPVTPPEPLTFLEDVILGPYVQLLPEHAPWALLDFGIRCVIAPDFADIFHNNCFKNGVLPVRLPREICEKLMEDARLGANARVTVDLERQVVVRPNGEEIPFTIDPLRRHLLLNGLDDIGQTMQHVKAIDGFEAKQRAAQPWLYA